MQPAEEELLGGNPYKAKSGLECQPDFSRGELISMAVAKDLVGQYGLVK